MLTMFRSFQNRICRRILGIEISGPPAKAAIRDLPVRRLLAGDVFPCRHLRAIPIMGYASDPSRGLAESLLFVKSIERILDSVKLVVELSQKSLGATLHGKIVKSGVEFDSFIRASLVGMYVKFDLLSFGLQLFDESPERIKNGRYSVHLWNVVIFGCCTKGMLDKAVGLFEVMPERNLGSWNILIYGFMRNNEADKAMEFFKRMGEKNVVTWTTIVNGLWRNEMQEKALETFFMMIEEGVKPNDVTLVSVLSSCEELGSLDDGMRIHDYIKVNGFRISAAVGAALVGMYAKCGNIQLAQQVFSHAEERDARTWSVMLRAFADHGNAEDTLECFEGMKLAGIEPDEAAFLGVLVACSRAGEVDRGIKLFQSMRLDYSIQPTMQHYAAMVDLYGRSGQLDEALRFIQSMEPTPDSVIWGTLATACRAHKNAEMAEYVAKQLLKLGPNHPGEFTLLFFNRDNHGDPNPAGLDPPGWVCVQKI